MFNQLRFERDDFREMIIKYQLIVIEKDNVINVLYKVKLMTEQAN